MQGPHHDDWGSLYIVPPSDNERLKLDLTFSIEPASPRGGHAE